MVTDVERFLDERMVEREAEANLLGVGTMAHAFAEVNAAVLRLRIDVLADMPRPLRWLGQLMLERLARDHFGQHPDLNPRW